MKQYISKEEIEKKYKIYNTLFNIIQKFLILVIIFIIIMLVYTYFLGIDSSLLCGGVFAECERVYGIEAAKTYILTLLIFSIFGLPLICIFAIVCIFVTTKRDKYKRMKENLNI